MEYETLKFENLNKTLNKKIIPIIDCHFAYVEHADYLSPHPASEYYFIIDDLSINLIISLK